MATTTFRGVVRATGGFSGSVTGGVTGDVTGNLTGGGAVVAAAGSNSQANATAITQMITIVTTVSATTRAVKLPTAAVGKLHFVHNAAATAVKIYPNTNDKIGAAATNAVGTAIAAGKTNIYMAQDSDTWRVMTGA